MTAVIIILAVLNVLVDGLGLYMLAKASLNSPHDNTPKEGLDGKEDWP